MTLRPTLFALSLLPAVFLAACETGPYVASPPTADEQRRLASFIGTRTAGAPQRCIPSYSGMQIEAVGDRIVAKWGGRVWVNEVQGSCRNADSMSAALVTESDPGGQYCQNSTWKVVSTSGGMVMGSCMLGPWTPYQN